MVIALVKAHTQSDFFSSIPVTFSNREVYQRLGFRPHTTRMRRQEKKKTDAAISQAQGFLALRGSAHILVVGKKTPVSLTLGTVPFKSKLLVRLLKNSSQAIVMAATAGSRIIEAMEELRADDLTRAVIYDAVASVAVDNALTWIQDYYRRELLRENKTVLSKRISCGYADFSLSFQKAFYKILGLSRLGVTITKSYMLVPEKSVTAVTGIVEVRS
ncbi:MAG: hypothetical protein ABH865_09810 [Candidatus Omnitrophota bacterium]